MIAADSSTWVAFIEGESGNDVRLLDEALSDQQVLMAPAVLSELLSDPKLPANIEKILLGLPLIEVEEGYWQRVGVLRAKLLGKKKRARLGDALIAQSCIDRGVALVTRDRDFQAFAEGAGLELLR
ncbi:MAG TPA: PIN domain-containing protein [Candidatus Saccharimonadales bacterium]|nr:PIN domain-containing protein [Candidatus Saccharimonadales bacterium]